MPGKSFLFLAPAMTKVIGKKDLKKTHFKRLHVLPGASAEVEGAVHRTALQGSRKLNRSVQPLSQLRPPQSLPDRFFLCSEIFKMAKSKTKGENTAAIRHWGGER